MKHIFLTLIVLAGVTLLHAKSPQQGLPRYSTPVAHIIVAKNNTGAYVYALFYLDINKKRILDKKTVLTNLEESFAEFRNARIASTVWIHASEEVPYKILTRLGKDLYKIKAYGVKIIHGTKSHDL